MSKRVLYITPGPIYDAHSKNHRRRYELLSNSFEGHIFTTSSKAEEIKIGRFVYHSMKSDGSLFSRIMFLPFCLKNAIESMINGERIDLVATYDPLLTGLFGYFISRFVRARFAVEVNGVYLSAMKVSEQKKSMLGKLKLLVYPRIMRFVLARADGVKLLFENQLSRMRSVLNTNVVQVFPDYVAVDDFKNMGEKKEVLFVGSPYRLKGVDLLINAFKKVASRYPEWILTILGWFPDVTDLEREIGGHKQIRVQPPVYHTAMPTHIGSCAFLVLPSRSEAMGRVLVEAMAAGKPRIGSNIDGIPTVINDNVDGLLFEAGNVEELAEVLDLLMGNAELRRRLGMAAEMRAKKEFSEEIYISKITRFYECVLRS